jgi:hypothetical protein
MSNIVTRGSCPILNFSLRVLRVLCGSAVNSVETLTAETQRAQRWRREMKLGHHAVAREVIPRWFKPASIVPDSIA